MGRRLLALLALALVTAAAPAAAVAHVQDELLPSQEWWVHDVGGDQVTPPGPGIPISIVDSGVDATQAEFANRPATTYENQQTTFGREEFHGTAVASVAAAPQNGVGIVGVYPQAALQIWDASPNATGISTFAAIADVEQAAQHCPAVINISFGSTNPDPGLETALLTAYHNGCMIVASAGNDGQNGNPVTYPAAWPHVFTVGASTESDQVAPFSTIGAGIDIVAPGQDITAAVPVTEDASGYTTVSGTSFSAPIVAAAAAWVWTLRPTLQPDQVEQILRESAKDIGPPGYDIASGWGLLDIPAALAAPTPPNDPDEPNDDIDEVKPGRLFRNGEPPLTTAAKPSNRIFGTLDATDDPRDVYRIWVPARKVVRVSVASAGTAAARIWGPQTVSTSEGLAARRRDLKGPSMTGGKKGSAAYVEVLLTGKSNTASYTLTVTASKR